MSRRELVVLGTASMVPTRTRNHNGYVLFFDDTTILFDPGEGTQRQMTLAGVSATDLSRIASTHLHGDHSLGLAGVVQRISGEGVKHRIDAVGYRLDEPDGVSFDPAALAAAGVPPGPDVGRLARDGVLALADGRTVSRAQVSVPRPGQSVAFVMDTRLCDAVHALADGVDLLVIESTFLHRDVELAERFAHLTCRQAASVAASAGARHLVLTHFSRRYAEPDELPLAFEREAREVFDGEVTVAADLDRVPLAPRRRAGAVVTGRR